MHARQQIREAVKTILSSQPIAWGSVIGSRIASTMQRWPYLMVFAESEQSDSATVNDPCVYSRQMVLSVAGMLRLPGTGDTYSIEDKMDEIAAEIETKLTQATLRMELSSVQSLDLVTTSMQVVIEEDGTDHAEVILSFRISYLTEEGSPETLI